MFGFHRKTKGVGSGNAPESRAGIANLKQNQPVARPAVAQAKQVDDLTNLVKSVADLNKNLGALSGNTPGAADDTESYAGEWAWLGEYAPYIGPFIAPYVPGILEKIGIQPRELPTTQSPEAPVAVGAAAPASDYNLPQLISLAAAAPEAAIKPFMGQLREELARQGIDENQFKAACTKIGKVL